jgi:hypothetical protein
VVVVHAVVPGATLVQTVEVQAIHERGAVSKYDVERLDGTFSRARSAGTRWNTTAREPSVMGVRSLRNPRMEREGRRGRPNELISAIHMRNQVRFAGEIQIERPNRARSVLTEEVNYACRFLLP